MKLGINASRARSGGAIAHLIGVFTEGNPVEHGFAEVHVWSYPHLLDALPNPPWLVKHCSPEGEATILRQLWWERFALPSQLRINECGVLLNVDAGTVCRFRPAVTMSRDMLAFESGEAARLGFSKARLRQVFLRYIQCRSLTHADASIFLTEYAAKVIQKSCGPVRSFKIIPHGVSDSFRRNSDRTELSVLRGAPIHILYVSPVWLFKHQWQVVRAVEMLRRKGFHVSLTLAGGGDDVGLRLLKQCLIESDPDGDFVEYLGSVPHDNLPSLLKQADIFVFASTCENMPNSLIEAMSSGLAIACSDRGPMPEVLRDGGIYFDPENPGSIAAAVEKIIADDGMRARIKNRALELSKAYSWKRCAHETFSYVAQTLGIK